jgi:hypothetical protein
MGVVAAIALFWSSVPNPAIAQRLLLLILKPPMAAMLAATGTKAPPESRDHGSKVSLEPQKPL